MELKSKEDIDRAIDRYKQIATRDYHSLKEEYFDLFGTHYIPVEYLKTAGLNNFKIYRVRSVEAFDNKQCKSFGYPPVEKSTRIQRASWSGKNVFYGSDSPKAALIEALKTYSQNEFYISQWGINANKIEHERLTFSSMAIDNMSPDNPWSTVLKTSSDYYNLFKSKVSDEEANAQAYLISRLSSLFVELADEKYHLTALLADLAMYSKSKAPGTLLVPMLIYPSVAEKLQACNFAIHPGFVDTYMSLEKVVKAMVKHTESGDVYIEFNEVAYPTSRFELEWSNITSDLLRGEYQVVELSCSCGDVLNIDTLETIKFSVNGVDVKLSLLLFERIKAMDLATVDLEDFFGQKDKLTALQFDIPIELNDVTVEQNGVTHKSVTIKIKFRLPIIHKAI